jgi:hypothetical protein
MISQPILPDGGISRKDLFTQAEKTVDKEELI